MFALHVSVGEHRGVVVPASPAASLRAGEAGQAAARTKAYETMFNWLIEEMEA